MAKRDVGYLGQRAGMTTGARAGKSKASAATRKAQNKGTVSGAIRKGAKGKGYNVYDAKTGTWKKLKTAGGSGKSGSYKGVKEGQASRPTTRVSPSKRGEGSIRNTALAKANQTNSGWVRGIGGMGKDQQAIRGKQLRKETGRSTTRGALIAKRAEDTRNQGRNIAAIASIPLVAAAGLKAAGGAAAARGAAAAIGRGAAPKAIGRGSAPKAIGSGRKPSAPSSGGRKAIGPAPYGPKKPTYSQRQQMERETLARERAAAGRRSAAAKKAAATRKANATKKK